MARSTSDYYKKNPKAAAKRVKQQARYNKTKKGKLLIGGANKLRKKLKCKKGEDASHTGPNSGKCESSKTNRTRPRKGKKYAKK
tara:strand:- start:78 stop:329 length:252 start_codon:yes stop_codon:yes gene_type:complete